MHGSCGGLSVVVGAKAMREGSGGGMLTWPAHPGFDLKTFTACYMCPHHLRLQACWSSPADMAWLGYCALTT